MSEYDDNRFMQLCEELREVITQILDMDGNTKELVRNEVQMILEDQ
jgi:hypothetical protein